MDKEEMVKEEALYFISNKSTVRETARLFGMSKSSIHRDFTKVLPTINPQMHKAVQELLQYNKEVRHIRGGISTQKKYKKMMA